MHAGIGDGVAFEQLAFGVRFHMVLVSVMHLGALLRPARVHVLLLLLGGRFGPDLGPPARLDGRVLRAGVSLPRHVHKTCVHQLAFLRQQPLRLQLPRELFKGVARTRPPAPTPPGNPKAYWRPALCPPPSSPQTSGNSAGRRPDIPSVHPTNWNSAAPPAA